MKGIVRSVNEMKKFGFIKVESEKDDYFFHMDDFEGHWDDLEHDFKTTQIGSITVEFDIAADKGKGPRAKNVRRVDFPNEG